MDIGYLFTKRSEKFEIRNFWNNLLVWICHFHIPRNGTKQESIDFSNFVLNFFSTFFYRQLFQHSNLGWLTTDVHSTSCDVINCEPSVSSPSTFPLVVLLQFQNPLPAMKILKQNLPSALKILKRNWKPTNCIEDIKGKHPRIFLLLLRIETFKHFTKPIILIDCN